MKQLDKLLFEQGGDCFFCKHPLAKADASIEHLFAQANGGSNADENTVACCKALNALLGNKPLKEKFQIVLRQKGAFRCPAESAKVLPTAPPQLAPVAPPRNEEQAAPEQARKLSQVVTPKPIPPASQPIRRAAVTCPTCKSSVPAAVGQVDYVCPKCRGAFRY